MAIPEEQTKIISFPFRGKSDVVQQIASKVLSSLFHFPKKKKLSKERVSAPKGLEALPHVSSTERLNQWIAANNLFCQILESEGVFGMTIDSSGSIVDISERVKETLGYEASLVLGTSADSLLHPEDAECMKSFADKGSLQARFLHQNGDEVRMRLIILSSPSVGVDRYFILAVRV